MPSRPRLSALLWDVDGTIAETELNGHRRAYNRAFADHGLPWHWDSRRYLQLLQTTGGRERIGRHAREQGWTDPIDLGALILSKQSHFRRIVSGGSLALRPGVRELMEEAAADGMPQAIVTTSARASVEALLGSLAPDLAARTTIWVCGEDVRHKKPDPEGYRRAVTALGLPASHCCAIEDSLAGGRSAVSAGLSCVLVRSALTEGLPCRELVATGARAVLPALAIGAQSGQASTAPPGVLPVEYGRLHPGPHLRLDDLRRLVAVQADPAQAGEL